MEPEVAEVVRFGHLDFAGIEILECDLCPNDDFVSLEINDDAADESLGQVQIVHARLVTGGPLGRDGLGFCDFVSKILFVPKAQCFVRTYVYAVRKFSLVDQVSASSAFLRY